jgi:hypothetical protein
MNTLTNNDDEDDDGKKKPPASVAGRQIFSSEMIMQDVNLA